VVKRRSSVGHTLTGSSNGSNAEPTAIAASKFIEELIVRRELARNFAWYNAECYDSFMGVPQWARDTLEQAAVAEGRVERRVEASVDCPSHEAEGSADRGGDGGGGGGGTAGAKVYTYAFDELEKGLTHDVCWNAAQVTRTC
jgi:hypothetical protein